MRMVTREQIEEVAEKIAKEYNPEKIILFGSYAWGNPSPDSDVDLFVIKDTEDPWKLTQEIDGSIYPRPFPLDLLVYTPRQVERREAMGDFFVSEILSKGERLYDT